MATDEQRKAAKAAEYKALEERLEEFAADYEENEKYVEAVERFELHYSERNAMLIVMQRPSATEVHSYKTWESKGRQVKKGQKGIRILAPAGQARKDTDKENEATGRRFFRLISVFDIRQTEEKEQDNAE